LQVLLVSTRVRIAALQSLFAAAGKAERQKRRRIRKQKPGRRSGPGFRNDCSRK
jgi:hypothetical protein